MLVLLIFFVFSRGQTAEKRAGKLLNKAAKAFADVAGKTNVNLGITSRSIGMIKIYRAWRCDEDFNTESFWQTFLTLTCLDFGYGKIGVPSDELIKDVASEEALVKTKNILESTNGMEEWNDLLQADGDEQIKKVEDILKTRKQEIKIAWKNDVRNLGENPKPKILKHIKKREGF